LLEARRQRYTTALRGKWIEQCHTRRGHVPQRCDNAATRSSRYAPNVPTGRVTTPLDPAMLPIVAPPVVDKCEVMHLGRRCQEASINDRESGIPSNAQASATDSSTGNMRSPSPMRICENHRSRVLPCSGSLCRLSSMPRRISASTRTLVPVSSAGIASCPTCNIGIGSAPLPDFGYDVLIQQEFHSRSHATPSTGLAEGTGKDWSGRSEPKRSKAMSVSECIRALARTDRSISALSLLAPRVSASARMRSASRLGTRTSTRTKPRAAARRRCLRVALRSDLLDPGLGSSSQPFRLYNRRA